MTLRDKLNDYLSKAILMPSTKNNMALYISKSDWIHAKYLCTSEEEDFKFNRGVVTYKGFELKAM